MSIDLKNILQRVDRQRILHKSNEKSLSELAKVSPTLQPEYSFRDNRTVADNLQTVDLFTRDPITLIAGLSKAQRAVLNQILFKQVKFKDIYVTNDTIAKFTGYCTKTVTRATELLTKLGLISKRIEGYGLANTYRLHPLFNDRSYRAKLGQYLPSLRLLPWFMALSISMLFSTVTDRNVPANLSHDFYKKSSSSSLSNTQDARARNKVPQLPASKKIIITRGGRDMEQIKSAIDAIRTLKLTVWGKIVLAAYPAAAIKYADQELYNRKDEPKNPLGLFKSLCQKYCDANKLKADFSRVDELKKQVPWEIGHYEVTENIRHCSQASDKKALKGTKEYLPGKEWDLKQQNKQIRRPVETGNVGSMRMPAWTQTEDQKRRDKECIATVEIDKAIEAAKAQGAMNPFMALLVESRKPLVDPTPAPRVELSTSPFLATLASIGEKMEKDSSKCIEKVQGDVQLYNERKAIPIAWEFSEELEEASYDELQEAARLFNREG